MRICIMGGLGTLGTDIIDAFASFMDLLVIDDGQESSIKEIELPPNVQVLRHNVASRAEYEPELVNFNPDFLIYLPTSLSQIQRRGFESVEGMKNVIEIAENSTNFPIIYIQSFLTRSTEVPISETSTIHIRDAYATWKYASELLLNDYAGKKMTVILSSVISQRLTVGAIPAFTRRITEGEDLSITNSSRDYLTPEDFVLFLNHTFEQEYWPAVCTVGSGKTVSTIEIADFVAKSLGMTLEDSRVNVLETKPTDPSSVVFDISLAKSYFHWSADGDIESSIKRCVDRNKLLNNPLRQHH